MAKKSETKSDEAQKQEITKVEPSQVLSPFEEMEQMFNSLFPRRWMHPFRWEEPTWPEAFRNFKSPKVDIIDRDNEVVVKAEVPGVKKEDLDITMTGNSVTIKGATSHEDKEERGDYYRCEISRGAFSRTLALPSNVDTDKAKATFNDGILELVIPKVEKAKRKSINID